MKQIGTLSSSACSKLFSSSMISGSANLLLAELSSILKIKSFKDKAKTKSVTSRESIYITITEERYKASISDEENPKTEYSTASSPQDISALALSDIRSFDKWNGKFVVPSTIEAHSCSRIEPCPICSDGMCTKCHGEKTVTCDACNGSKECSSCDGSGQYPCYSCNETGECRHCDGSGEEDCDDCDGDGWVWVDCRACNGTGRYTLRNGYDVECKVCHGSGHHHKEDCWNCNGTGSVDCHVCDGSGRCEKCGGEGHVECRACHGTGTCGKCKGKGYLKCRNCKGSGLCPSCKGSQTITCRRCLGTGTYQTFRCIALEEENHTSILKDKSIDCQFGIDSNVVGKRHIYNGSPYIIDFGKPKVNDLPMMDFLNRTFDSSYSDKMVQYRNSLLNADGTSKIASDIYVKASIEIEQFPIVQFAVSYSNETFTFYIVGTDGRVFADKTPSLWDKFCAWLY